MVCDKVEKSAIEPSLPQLRASLSPFNDPLFIGDSVDRAASLNATCTKKNKELSLIGLSLNQLTPWS
jgi:hypothetical protein